MTTATVIPAADMSRRLTAAANDVEELQEALVLARRRRDELVIVAHDEVLMSYGDIGGAARLSRARIIAIMAKAG